MWYTPLFPLFPPCPPYFPCWTSFADFLGSVCFSMCGFAEFFLCYGSWFLCFASLVLLQFLQQRKVSSAKQHEYDGTTSSFTPVFANIGSYFHCIHWPVLCVFALPLDCVYLLQLQHDFSSSCGPSHISTILPAVISNIRPLWTHVGLILLPPPL